jgi:hypothetical protein
VSKLLRWLAPAVLALAPLTAAEAHHSFSAEFDDEKIDTIEGEVTRIWWRNPHVRYEVTAPGESGESTVWELQTNATTGLAAMGWTQDTIKLGDHVTVEGSRARSGEPKLYVRWIEIAGGKTLAVRGPRVAETRIPVSYEVSEPFRAGAERPVDITGTWNVSQGFRLTVDDLEPKPTPFTEEGRRRYEANRAGHDPALRCVPVGMPRTFGGPRGLQIFDAGDFYLFVHEAGDEHRWVWMDGRAATDQTPLTYTGFSVGRWEGRELVIETDHLLPGWLDGSGLPMSGPETKLVERWAFSEDGTEIMRTMTITDPLYTEPLMRTRGGKRADLTILEESCDPDSFYEDVYEDGGMAGYFEALGASQ